MTNVGACLNNYRIQTYKEALQVIKEIGWSSITSFEIPKLKKKEKTVSSLKRGYI